jgi:hypothetical protein
MVDKFGLATVLNGLACICSGKADHLDENWQDKRLARAWEKACVHLMNEADHSAVKAVSCCSSVSQARTCRRGLCPAGSASAG